MRLIDFSDGFTSNVSPVTGIIPAGGLVSYASDAAFVTGKGSAAANGDVYYNTAYDQVRIYRASAWEVFGAKRLVGTRAAPQAIVAATGIAFSGWAPQTTWYVQGSGGAVSISAAARITAGNYVGQRITVVGKSDTNTVTIPNGNGISSNGDILLEDDTSATYEWDGTNWRLECTNH